MVFSNGLICCYGKYDHKSLAIDVAVTLNLSITFKKIFSMTALAYRLNNNKTYRGFITTCYGLSNSQISIGWLRTDGSAQYVSYIILGI